MILGMKRPHHGISVAAPSVSVQWHPATSSAGEQGSSGQVNGASCNSLHGWVVRVSRCRERLGRGHSLFFLRTGWGAKGQTPPIIK